jgi:hypothetical protein
MHHRDNVLVRNRKPRRSRFRCALQCNLLASVTRLQYSGRGCAVTSHKFRSADVPAEVRSLLGDHASEWMLTPNRLFDNLAPCDLAVSPEGARVVLQELNRFSTTEIARFVDRRKT